MAARRRAAGADITGLDHPQSNGKKQRFYQTPVIDLAEPDPIPDFVLDQSLPDESED